MSRKRETQKEREMIALEVKKGTKGKVIKEGKEWHGSNIKDHTTTKDLLFFAEDIRIDPLGNLGPDPNGVTIGGAYAKAGWYGFYRDGWYLLVPFGDVTAH